MAAPHSSQPFDFDIAPVFKMYLESVEAWKKNYETLVRTTNNKKTPRPAEPMTSAYDAAMVNWQKSGEEFFKRFVEQQIELCRFFGRRWEQYLKLPEQLANCHSATELSHVQTEFFSQLTTDYANESSKLVQPFNAFISNWAAGQRS
jgi:hypothetical protein